MLLITGITGNTGKYFLRELSLNHFSGRIRFIIRKSSNIDLKLFTNLNYEILLGDLNDSEFLDLALKGVTKIFHIASIFLSEKIIDSGIKNHIYDYVLVHTSGLYSKFKSASYSYKKIEENITLLGNKLNLNIVFLRPTMIYGELNDLNISKFIRFIDRFYFVPMVGNGSAKIQPVHYQDLATAFLKILNSNIKIGDYTLSGKNVLSIYDLYNLIIKNLKVKRIIIKIHPSLVYFFAKLLCFFSLNKFCFEEKVLRLTEDRNYSNQNAVSDFGYNPLPFQYYLNDEINHYLSSK
jgi:nucleoside-diphosphate-sugar epimerase